MTQMLPIALLLSLFRTLYLSFSLSRLPSGLCVFAFAQMPLYVNYSLQSNYFVFGRLDGQNNSLLDGK